MSSCGPGAAGGPCVLTSCGPGAAGSPRALSCLPGHASKSLSTVSGLCLPSPPLKQGKYPLPGILLGGLVVAAQMCRPSCSEHRQHCCSWTRACRVSAARTAGPRPCPATPGGGLFLRCPCGHRPHRPHRPSGPHRAESPVRPPSCELLAPPWPGVGHAGLLRAPSSTVAAPPLGDWEG